MREKVIFYLNGKRYEANANESSMMLSDFLRYHQGLTGTKVVCAEGDCGACTILKSFNDNGTTKFLAINSCILLTALLDGESIITVEGLKNEQSLNCVQESLVKNHGSQCGFCTPGFVMAISGLIEKKIHQQSLEISKQEAKNAITGNLCRCTGYEPILNSVLDIRVEKESSLKERFLNDQILDELKRINHSSLHLKSEDFEFFSPDSLPDALKFLSENSNVYILGAGTDLGVVHNKRKIKLNKILSLKKIKELSGIQNNGKEIIIGSNVTLDQFRSYIYQYVPEFSTYLAVFASPQIKHSATVVGNIATASPIGDTSPVFLALESSVLVADGIQIKEIEIKDFFISYRKINLSKNELITGIKFKIPQKDSYLKCYKISNRKDLDISSVNLSINLNRHDDNKRIKDIVIAAGGVAAIPQRFFKTEDFLKDKEINSKNLADALGILHSEYTPLTDLRASSSYRRIILEKTFMRFFSDLGETR